MLRCLKCGHTSRNGIHECTARFQYVVACTKVVNDTTYVQTFGPYASAAEAEEHSKAWNDRDGWHAEVSEVYPPSMKRSLLQPSRIGKDY